jgi:YVTN family beta-propeller protein
MCTGWPHSRRSAADSKILRPTILLTLALLGLDAGESFGQPFAYVTNNQSTFVSVIDTATNRVVSTIPDRVGGAGVAVDPRGRFVYVTHSGGQDTVSVIDAVSNNVFKLVGVGFQPRDVVVLPNGNFAYVANSSQSVSVLETVGHTVVSTVPLMRTPNRIAASPDGSRVYTTNTDGTVSVISTSSNSVIATISLGGPPIGPPQGLTVARDGSRVYVADGSQGIAVIATASNSVIGRVAVSAASLALTPDGTRLYVPSPGGLTVLDAATLGVITVIPGIAGGVDVGITPDGQRAYVVRNQTLTATFNSVTVVDIGTNSVATTIPLGSNLPVRIAVGPSSPGMPPAGAPGQPTNLSVTQGGGLLNLSWNAPSSGVTPTGYRLDFVSGTVLVATVVTGNMTSMSLAIPAGTQGVFAVTVTALANTTSGPPSASVTFTIGSGGCSGPPPTPTGLSGSVVGTTATVRWSPSPGATSYVVHAGTIQGSADLFNGNVGPIISLSASGVPPGFRAWVRIFAINGCGSSAGADVLVQ